MGAAAQLLALFSSEAHSQDPSSASQTQQTEMPSALILALGTSRGASSLLHCAALGLSA